MEWERFARYDHPLSALMIDMDHFKRIDDRWGHDGGDAVLRAFAERLRGIVHASDTIARNGGEEFGILLPETDLGVGIADHHRNLEALIREAE